LSKKYAESNTLSTDAFSVALFALIERLGLTVESANSKLEPVTSDETIYSQAFDDQSKSDL
jgi:hypothetical protein